jgi:hypothetical protein
MAEPRESSSNLSGLMHEVLDRNRRLGEVLRELERAVRPPRGLG